MIVAGVMSGTSLDGIDVAIVDIRGNRIRPLAFHSTPYPKAVGEALLGVSNAMTHTATIARLSFLLGELYADAIKQASREFKPALIGLHGQTICVCRKLQATGRRFFTKARRWNTWAGGWLARYRLVRLP